VRAIPWPSGGGALGDASTPGTPASSIAASAHRSTYRHVAVAGGTCVKESGVRGLPTSALDVFPSRPHRHCDRASHPRNRPSMGIFLPIDRPIEVHTAMWSGQLSLIRLWSAEHRHSGVIGQSRLVWLTCRPLLCSFVSSPLVRNLQNNSAAEISISPSSRPILYCLLHKGLCRQDLTWCLTKLLFRWCSGIQKSTLQGSQY